MEQEDLKSIMLFQLQHINAGTEILTEDVIHETVLSDSDGFGPANSKNNYQNNVIYSISQAGKEVKKWPADWMKMSVAELASKLLMLVLFFSLSFAAKSQLQVTIGAGKSELRDNAITIGLVYLKSFDSIWKNSQYVKVGKTSTLSIYPEMYLQTGTQDAFSSITVRATALFNKFQVTHIRGFATPDPRKVMHNFPISVGAETNNLFNILNGIVEAGYVPWYRGATSSKLLQRTKVGVFLQAGHKFFIDSSGNTAIGGEKDESEERVNRTIARVKGSFGIDSKTIVKINGLDVGLVGTADVWYDFINGATYYRIDGRGRFFLDKERYIDIIYQKGSGAPNFNTGDQFGVGLTITF